MSTSRTWKQHLMGGAGLVFVVLGALVALAGVIVVFSSGLGTGSSVLFPGLVVVAAGSALRGYARGETGVTEAGQTRDRP